MNGKHSTLNTWQVLLTILADTFLPSIGACLSGGDQCRISVLEWSFALPPCLSRKPHLSQPKWAENYGLGLGVYSNVNRIWPAEIFGVRGKKFRVCLLLIWPAWRVGKGNRVRKYKYVSAHSLNVASLTRAKYAKDTLIFLLLSYMSERKSGIFRERRSTRSNSFHVWRNQ